MVMHCVPDSELLESLTGGEMNKGGRESGFQPRLAQNRCRIMVLFLKFSLFAAYALREWRMVSRNEPPFGVQSLELARRLHAELLKQL